MALPDLSLLADVKISNNAQSNIERALNGINARLKPINVKINDKGFEKLSNLPLGRIAADAKEFDKSLKSASARIFAFTAVLSVLEGIRRGFVNIIATTIDLEKRFTDINVIFQQSERNFESFKKQLFDVARATSQSISTVTDVANEFARQGLSVQETATRTRDALLLINQAGLSAQKSVESLTAAINTFTNEALTSTEIVNRLANVDAAFAVSSGDLANSLARVGNSASDAGVSFNQLIAIVTALQQRTARGGSVIGNSLKTIFTRLQRQDTIEAFENLGIQVQDAKGNFGDLLTIIKQFASVYDSASDSQKSFLAELVGGVYQINQLKALIADLSSNASVYDDALQVANSTTDEAIKRQEQLNQTLSAIIQNAKTNFTELATQIGKLSFEPALRNILNITNDIFEVSKKAGQNSLENGGVDWGKSIGEGILKGIGTALSGPGLVLIAVIFYKLLRQIVTFSKDAFTGLLGFSSEQQKINNLQVGLNHLLSEGNSHLVQRLAQAKSLAEQNKILVQLAREYNAAMAVDSTRTQAAFKRYSSAGLSYNSESNRFRTPRLASGYIPERDKTSEIIGALASGYIPGQVKTMNIPNMGKVIYNDAEKVKYVPGFAQPFINPPKNSKAGISHRTKSLFKTGIDPYAPNINHNTFLNKGFIPNFVKLPYVQTAFGPRLRSHLLEPVQLKSQLFPKKNSREQIDDEKVEELLKKLKADGVSSKNHEPLSLLDKLSRAINSPFNFANDIFTFYNRKLDKISFYIPPYSFNSLADAIGVSPRNKKLRSLFKDHDIIIKRPSKKKHHPTDKHLRREREMMENAPQIEHPILKVQELLKHFKHPSSTKKLSGFSNNFGRDIISAIRSAPDSFVLRDLIKYDYLIYPGSTEPRIKNLLEQRVKGIDLERMYKRKKRKENAKFITPPQNQNQLIQKFFNYKNEQALSQGTRSSLASVLHARRKYREKLKNIDKNSSVFTQFSDLDQLSKDLYTQKLENNFLRDFKTKYADQRSILASQLKTKRAGGEVNESELARNQALYGTPTKSKRIREIRGRIDSLYKQILNDSLHKDVFEIYNSAPIQRKIRQFSRNVSDLLTEQGLSHYGYFAMNAEVMAPTLLNRFQKQGFRSIDSDLRDKITNVMSMSHSFDLEYQRGGEFFLKGRLHNPRLFAQASELGKFKNPLNRFLIRGKFYQPKDDRLNENIVREIRSHKSGNINFRSILDSVTAFNNKLTASAFGNEFFYNTSPAITDRHIIALGLNRLPADEGAKKLENFIANVLKTRHAVGITPHAMFELGFDMIHEEEKETTLIAPPGFKGVRDKQAYYNKLRRRRGLPSILSQGHIPNFAVGGGLVQELREGRLRTMFDDNTIKNLIPASKLLEKTAVDKFEEGIVFRPREGKFRISDFLNLSLGKAAGFKIKGPRNIEASLSKNSRFQTETLLDKDTIQSIANLNPQNKGDIERLRRSMTKAKSGAFIRFTTPERRAIEEKMWGRITDKRVNDRNNLLLRIGQETFGGKITPKEASFAKYLLFEAVGGAKRGNHAWGIGDPDSPLHNPTLRKKLTNVARLTPLGIDDETPFLKKFGAKRLLKKLNTLRGQSFDYDDLTYTIDPLSKISKRDAKKIIGNARRLILSNGRFDGLIPSFANPLSDAIQREYAAGAPLSKIKIERSSRLINPKNPLGLAVTNTRDEPAGINQGINRAIREGHNPKIYGVPNFAYRFQFNRGSNPKSFLSFELDKKNKTILEPDMFSASKGDARKNFIELSKFARKNHLSISSGNFIPQFDKLKGGESGLELFYKLFPQFRYRQGVSDLTSGEFAIGSVNHSKGEKFSRYFIDINDLESQIARLSDHEIKRLNFGSIKDEFLNLSGVFDAVKREVAAGVPFNKIKLEQSGRLKNKDNPLGLAVTNTRDEPGGINQGINRAIREGRNPKTYGIPNFANRFDKFGELDRAKTAREVLEIAKQIGYPINERFIKDDINARKRKLKSYVAGQVTMVRGSSKTGFTTRTEDKVVNRKDQGTALTAYEAAIKRQDDRIMGINSTITEREDKRRREQEKNRLKREQKIARQSQALRERVDFRQRAKENAARIAARRTALPQEISSAVINDINKYRENLIQALPEKLEKDLKKYQSGGFGRFGTFMFNREIKRTLNNLELSGINTRDSRIRDVIDEAKSRQRILRGDRFRNVGLGASFALPLIAETANNIFSNPNKPEREQRAFSGVLSGVSAGGTIAALSGFSVPGLIGGAILAGITSMKSLADNLTDSFDDIIKKSQELANKKQEEIQSISNVISTQSQLIDAINSNASSRLISSLTNNRNNAISNVSDPTLRKEMIDIFREANPLEALQEISLKANESAQKQREEDQRRQVIASVLESSRGFTQLRNIREATSTTPTRNVAHLLQRLSAGALTLLGEPSALFSSKNITSIRKEDINSEKFNEIATILSREIDINKNIDSRRIVQWDEGFTLGDFNDFSRAIQDFLSFFEDAELVKRLLTSAQIQAKQTEILKRLNDENSKFNTNLLKTSKELTKLANINLSNSSFSNAINVISRDSSIARISDELNAKSPLLTDLQQERINLEQSRLSNFTTFQDEVARSIQEFQKSSVETLFSDPKVLGLPNINDTLLKLNQSLNKSDVDGATTAVTTLKNILNSEDARQLPSDTLDKLTNSIRDLDHQIGASRARFTQESSRLNQKENLIKEQDQNRRFINSLGGDLFNLGDNKFISNLRGGVLNARERFASIGKRKLDRAFVRYGGRRELNNFNQRLSQDEFNTILEEARTQRDTFGFDTDTIRSNFSNRLKPLATQQVQNVAIKNITSLLRGSSFLKNFGGGEFSGESLADKIERVDLSKAPDIAKQIIAQVESLNSTRSRNREEQNALINQLKSQLQILGDAEKIANVKVDKELGSQTIEEQITEQIKSLSSNSAVLNDNTTALRELTTAILLGDKLNTETTFLKKLTLNKDLTEFSREVDPIIEERDKFVSELSTKLKGGTVTTAELKKLEELETRIKSYGLDPNTKNVLKKEEYQKQFGKNTPLPKIFELEQRRANLSDPKKQTEQTNDMFKLGEIITELIKAISTLNITISNSSNDQNRNNTNAGGTNESADGKVSVNGSININANVAVDSSTSQIEQDITSAIQKQIELLQNNLMMVAKKTNVKFAPTAIPA